MLAERNGLKATVFSAYYSENSSYVSVNFGALKRLYSDDELNSFRLELNRLPGVDLPENAIADGRYPTITFDKLMGSNNLKSFTDAIKSLLSK